MKTRLHALTATMALAGIFGAFPLSAHALGFGSMRVQSEIGQPLRAEVDLRLSPGESPDDLAVRHAGAVEYERQGVTYTAVLSSLSVAIQTRAGQSIAIVTTRAPVNEPVVQFILQTESSQGRMFRSFSLPIRTSAIAGPSASETANSSLAITAKDAVGKTPRNFDEAQSVYRNEAAKLYDRLIEIGTRPGAVFLSRIKGSGKNDALSSILPKVVPKGWRGYAGDAGMRWAKSVKWVGANRYWLTVLDEVMVASGLTATVDWNRKEVTFRGLEAMSKEWVAPAESIVSSVTTQARAIEAKPADVAAAVRTSRKATQAARAQAKKAWAKQKKAQAAQASAQANEVAKTTQAAQAAQVAPADLAQQLTEARAATERAQAETQRAQLAQANEVAKATQAAQAAQVAQADLARQLAEARAVIERAQAENQRANLTANLTAKDVKDASDCQAMDLRTAQEAVKAQQAAIDRQARQVQPDLEATQAKLAFKAAVAADAKAQTEADDRRRAAAAADSPPVLVPAAEPANFSSLNRVKLIGEGSQPEAYAVRSSGFNVALFSAVQRILPPGWSLFTQDNSLLTVDNTGWRGGSRHWLIVLDETLGPLGIQATVNASRKEVVLTRMR